MSRIGKMPVPVPGGVSVAIEGNLVKVKGPKGELSQRLPAGITIRQEDNVLYVERLSDSKEHKSLHGLTRSLVNNMVVGVTEGFSKSLEIVGVGYRASKSGSKVTINVGYSQPIEIEAPSGIQIDVPAPTRMVVSGADKQAVGELAAKIRGLRLPEPYKGKGIRYEGERVRRKAGKAGKAGS